MIGNSKENIYSTCWSNSIKLHERIYTSHSGGLPGKKCPDPALMSCSGKRSVIRGSLPVTGVKV